MPGTFSAASLRNAARLKDQDQESLSGARWSGRGTRAILGHGLSASVNAVRAVKVFRLSNIRGLDRKRITRTRTQAGWPAALCLAAFSFHSEYFPPSRRRRFPGLPAFRTIRSAAPSTRKRLSERAESGFSASFSRVPSRRN